MLPDTDSATSPVGSGARPSESMHGYLKKWTNYYKGYQLRWFVFENGILSYYKHEDDVGNASRGSISMRIARLHMGSEGKTKFKITGKSSVKYILKAADEVEAKRWFGSLHSAAQRMNDQANQDERQKTQSAEALWKLRDAPISDLHSDAATICEPRDIVSLARSPSAKQTISDDPPQIIRGTILNGRKLTELLTRKFDDKWKVHPTDV
ncbi:hypothetical protein F5Y10DRAFT_273622 [Nemania abortiva]|nr:hypothetical protein F5Y10DRAFT_273622 [Nemania abortiva]